MLTPDLAFLIFLDYSAAGGGQRGMIQRYLLLTFDPGKKQGR